MSLALATLGPAFGCPKSFQTILSKRGFLSQPAPQKRESRHKGGFAFLVEAGGILAPSIALALRTIGCADVHFGILSP